MEGGRSDFWRISDFWKRIWYLDFCVMNVGSRRYGSEKLGLLLKTFRCASN
jgi:hypothetical protein